MFRVCCLGSPPELCPRILATQNSFPVSDAVIASSAATRLCLTWSWHAAVTSSAQHGAGGHQTNGELAPEWHHQFAPLGPTGSYHGVKPEEADPQFNAPAVDIG
jgi:hypothetical protein